MNNNDIIIVPDIHGRAFWKDYIFNNHYEDKQIIFLGDYTDPYDYEFITYDQTLTNLKEIILFKKDHPDNVTLLLGNHDMSYIAHTMPCRYDDKNADEIINLFKDNIILFKLLDIRIINNKKYTFSHSFISNLWISTIDIHNELTIEEVMEICNNAVIRYDTTLLYTLCAAIGFERGGRCNYGSIVWSDLAEPVYYPEELPKDIDYQIFGHTQMNNKPYIDDKFACLDVRKCFILTEDGKILN